MSFSDGCRCLSTCYRKTVGDCFVAEGLESKRKLLYWDALRKLNEALVIIDDIKFEVDAKHAKKFEFGCSAHVVREIEVPD